MLAIRLQRLGRKKYPVYRVAVQEAQRHPSSGRVVAYVGSYNPHTKQASFNKDKIETYLKNGAQPSPRVVKLLEADKITLPAWVKKKTTTQARNIRHPEKLRKNQPEEPAPSDMPEAEPVQKPLQEANEESTTEASTEPADTATEKTE